jgi:hypothetical protein
MRHNCDSKEGLLATMIAVGLWSTIVLVRMTMRLFQGKRHSLGIIDYIWMFPLILVFFGLIGRKEVSAPFAISLMILSGFTLIISTVFTIEYIQGCA